ncbi:MAG: WbqC family protein [Flavobacteriales bacterium]|jgi:hypothetical protein|nr:WbqC family protein [Flavobacteriales bacterium]
MIVIQPSYFGPISQFAVMSKYAEVGLEVCDNYQKQTYRNRCYIYGANGKLMLNIPIIHQKDGYRQLTKNIKIEPAFNWKTQHLKSIQTAYQTSPFFEFYEDDFLAFFEKDYTHLLDVNISGIKLISDLLGLEITFSETSAYKPVIELKKDYRFLANAKTEQPFTFETYTQMFDDKYGYIPNLSILDLLFMEGPNALNYLENQVTEI